MYETIKSIWYEKLQLGNQNITNNDKITDLCKKQDALEEKIKSSLGEKEQLLLDELIDSYFELTDLLQADAFVKGFKLGGGITIEILK